MRLFNDGTAAALFGIVVTAAAGLGAVPSFFEAGGSLLLKDAIHAHIRDVLDRVQGNKRRAARELGVARATLERK